jgi:hypothetical protein
MVHRQREASLFERVERIQDRGYGRATPQTQVDRSERQTIYIDKQRHAEWITREFRL